MDIKSISPAFCISPQLSVDDVAEAAARGFKSIVCNRPDGEGDQPCADDIRAAAEARGLSFRAVPIAPPASPGALDQADIAAFASAVNELPKPVLGYCRTGGRAGLLWKQASEAGLIDAG